MMKTMRMMSKKTNIIVISHLSYVCYDQLLCQNNGSFLITNLLFMYSKKEISYTNILVFASHACLVMESLSI